MLSTTLGGNALEALTPNKEFWDAEKTLKFLAEGDYFCDKPGEVGKTNWPEGLIPFLDEGKLFFCKIMLYFMHFRIEYLHRAIGHSTIQHKS